MFYALDDNGEKIHVNDAIPGCNYKCQMCDNLLYPRHGDMKTWHFAHYKGQSCQSIWYKDYDEWRNQMMSIFSSEHCEVVIEYEEEKQLADVVIGNTVIEFLGYRIPSKVFKYRTEYFRKAGYRVAYIFDGNQYLDERLFFLGDSEKCVDVEWKNAPKFWNIYGRPQDLKDISLCLWLGEGDDVRRISYCGGTKEKPSFRNLKIQSNPITLSDDMNVDELFMTKNDEIANILKDIPQYIKKTLSYYAGSSAYSSTSDEWICPDTDKPYKIKDCCECVSCALVVDIVNLSEDDHKTGYVYCCPFSDLSGLRNGEQNPRHVDSE